MPIQDRIQRTIFCDFAGCEHNKDGFVFWQQSNGQPDPDTQFPDWVSNLRGVRVDNGTPQGVMYIYCSGECESKAALLGMHDPPRTKRVAVAQPGEVAAVAKAAGETEALKTESGKPTIVPSIS
jgi:hypothetical protein